MKIKMIIPVIFFSLIFLICCLIISLASVGSKPSSLDRQNYLKRASNFDGKEFHNEEETVLIGKSEDNDPDRMSFEKTVPDIKLPYKTPDFIDNPEKQKLPVDKVSITWFGHSSVLIQMHGMNILIDPFFSKRTSPVSWAGPKRFSDTKITAENLPEIDVLLLTHDHYDHLDYKFIKQIDSKVKKYIVPLGVECHLQKWKISKEKVTNLAWWENAELDGLTITAAPARHFSGRWITGHNQSLWNSYVLKDEYFSIFDSGDTGYGSHFKKIHEIFGDFDLAIMECGQYNMRWASIHSFPEQTVQESIEIGARIAFPVHWGSVCLSTNGWDDSILRFAKAADEKKLSYITPFLGQTVNLEKPDLYKEAWYSEH